ncbi:MAG TPA: hypothetical protein VGK64_02930 [Bryobacteraceae bacterium]
MQRKTAGTSLVVVANLAAGGEQRRNGGIGWSGQASGERQACQ